tara:strand:- start:44 stop:178 length:135 start_codon:yes stop_codon:yes gene_type:complete
VKAVDEFTETLQAEETLKLEKGMRMQHYMTNEKTVNSLTEEEKR